MAKLSIGIDLSGRTITNSAASGLTITASKTIASTHSGNYIAESSSGAYYHANGEDTYFYDTGTNLGSFDLPENFGVITEVDESAVFFDYLTRSDNEKTYVLSEDNEKVPFDPYKVPIDHASTSSEYGAGNANKYGHVKLSDATNSTSGTSGGTAATPKAVHDAVDAVDVKFSKNKLVHSAAVNLSNYGISNPYTFPNDGYVEVKNLGGSDFAFISGSDFSRTIDLYPPTTVFVRKGMKGWGSGGSYFYPLS